MEVCMFGLLPSPSKTACRPYARDPTLAFVRLAARVSELHYNVLSGAHIPLWVEAHLLVAGNC